MDLSTYPAVVAERKQLLARVRELDTILAPMALAILCSQPDDYDPYEDEYDLSEGLYDDYSPYDDRGAEMYSDYLILEDQAWRDYDNWFGRYDVIPEASGIWWWDRSVASRLEWAYMKELAYGITPAEFDQLVEAEEALIQEGSGTVHLFTLFQLSYQYMPSFDYQEGDFVSPVH